MSESAPRTVALLLNYKTAVMTLRCLVGLRAATRALDRVLVLDNGSGAAEAELLRAGVVDCAEVELRLLPDNLGYCAAMNLGLAWAREIGAEHVLFLNSDVEVEDGFLEPLVGVLDNDSAVAGVAPTVLRLDGRVWSQGAVIRFGPNLNQLLSEGRQPAPRQTGPRAVGYLPGACVLYRCADLVAVGGLDESYFMYFEDAVLGETLRARGRRLLWLPWVRVTHDASAASGGGRAPLRKYLTAVNGVRFLRGHFRARLWIAFLLFDCLGLPLAFVTGGCRAGWAKACGILDGLRGHTPGKADVARWVRT